MMAVTAKAGQGFVAESPKWLQIIKQDEQWRATSSRACRGASKFCTLRQAMLSNARPSNGGDLQCGDLRRSA